MALPFNISFAFVFAALGYMATFLMLHLWGYPYDKDTRTSEAPKWAMRLHRVLGYAFVVCYVVMMWRMVPRLFSYQVELPARTVVHILLGVTVGCFLLIKISIARFFRHLEEWMPYLGVAVLLCTTLLVVLSLPAAFREHSLAHGTPGGDPFGPQSLERVARLLPDADLPEGTDLKRLATAEGATGFRGSARARRRAGHRASGSPPRHAVGGLGAGGGDRRRDSVYRASRCTWQHPGQRWPTTGKIGRGLGGYARARSGKSLRNQARRIDQLVRAGEDPHPVHIDVLDDGREIDSAKLPDLVVAEP